MSCQGTPSEEIFPPSGLLMANCVCHLDWAMGCLGTWLTITLGKPGAVCLDEVSIWISEAGSSPQSVCANLIRSVEGTKKTGTKKNSLSPDSLLGVVLAVPALGL